MIENLKSVWRKMDPQKLFIQLESNNLHESEEAKKRLTENFSASK